MRNEAMDRLLTPQALTAAREYLASVPRQNALIALRLSQLDDLREKSQRLTRAFSALPGGGGNAPDRVGEAAAALADMERQLLGDYKTLTEKQIAVRRLLSALPDERQRLVLEMRYLEGMPFFRIAMALSYDERQIYRIHEKGLRRAALMLALEDESPLPDSP